QSS
ncbi:penicillin-binding 5, C-terminal domain protein, partial [Vibrio parahaemolyticus V-223/04]